MFPFIIAERRANASEISVAKGNPAKLDGGAAVWYNDGRKG